MPVNVACSTQTSDNHMHIQYNNIFIVANILTLFEHTADHCNRSTIAQMSI